MAVGVGQDVCTSLGSPNCSVHVAYRLLQTTVHVAWLPHKLQCLGSRLLLVFKMWLVKDAYCAWHVCLCVCTRSRMDGLNALDKIREISVLLCVCVCEFSSYCYYSLLLGCIRPHHFTSLDEFSTTSLSLYSFSCWSISSYWCSYLFNFPFSVDSRLCLELGYS